VLDVGANVRLAREWADWYRSIGLNPLPSKMSGRKKPLIRFSHLWTEPVPDFAWTSLRLQTTNIQVMTGVFWGICVIDLDGEAGREVWEGWSRQFGCPETWVVSRGPGSRHLWFETPRELGSLRGRVLWRGEGRHQLVEILGDRDLVTAPPSIHVDTGQRYEWLVGPHELPRPAPLPSWVLSIPGESGWGSYVIPVKPLLPRPSTTRGCYSRSQVYNAIEGRFTEIALGHGLRLASSQERSSGWIDCHAVTRDDHHPSASFSPSTGAYSEGDSKPVSFFDLLCLLQPTRYTDWLDCVNQLGSIYCNR
jgi:hypothetical protein